MIALPRFLAELTKPPVLPMVGTVERQVVSVNPLAQLVRFLVPHKPVNRISVELFLISEIYWRFTSECLCSTQAFLECWFRGVGTLSFPSVREWRINMFAGDLEGSYFERSPGVSDRAAFLV